MLMLSPVFLCITCNDDDDLISDYRIIQSTTSYDGTAYYDTWFDYEGNNIAAIRGYNGDELSRISMQYHANDLMTAYTYYSDDNGSWNEEGSKLFTYDGSGNLESFSFLIDELLYKVNYIYERGSGNYCQLLELHEYDFFLGIEPQPTMPN